MRKIGEEVTIRDDIRVGDDFPIEDSGGRYSIGFSEGMKKFRGAKAVITDYKYKGELFVGYELNISPAHVFSDGMFEDAYDTEADDLINHMLKLVPSQLINHSLDTRNKNLFMKLTLNSVDKRQTT